MMKREGKTSNIETVFTQLMQPLDVADLDTNLVTEFFFVFSRFEYALKRAGYFKPNRDGYAEPNWPAFAEMIKPIYRRDENSSLDNAIGYLLSRPPQRQMVEKDKAENKVIRWRKLKRRKNQNEIGWLLVIVRTVRNNLFHGGKYPYTPLDEPARNKPLLESSLLVLGACLHWEETVRDDGKRTVRDWFMSDLDE